MNDDLDSPRYCLNCGAVLAGDYCSQCGQRDTGGELRFSDLVSDLVEEFFTWDSRIWRTLIPLLFRPGFLTAEYMAGRRARYVPPLRLYLIISFALFLVLSFTDIVAFNADGPTGDVPVPAAAGPGHRLSGGTTGAGVTGDPAGPGSVVGGSPEDGAISIDLARADSPPWLQQIDRRMEENAARLRQKPGAFVDRLREYLPQMMFLLLPVFALLLKFCYLFTPYHYLQHLVFSLNYHSFVFLLYLIGAAVESLAVDFDRVLFLCLLVYLPVGLWRAYGSGVGGALGRALVIYLLYGVLLVLAFAAVSVVTLVTM